MLKNLLLWILSPPMKRSDKLKQDRDIKRIMQIAKRQGMKVPLLPDQKILKNDKIKVYSAEEAKAEKVKRDKKANQKPIILNGSFIAPKVKENKTITQDDMQNDLLLKFSEPLEREQNDMVLQAMRYIIGPQLDFPIDIMYRLFGWQNVKRHPITELIDENRKFKVFYYWGDRVEELLKNKKNHLALIWHETDLPIFKEDDNGKITGLINNWKNLYDDDSEYSGDPLD